MITFTPFEQWIQRQAKLGQLPDTVVFRLDGTMVLGQLSEAEMHPLIAAIPLPDQSRAARAGGLVAYNTKKQTVQILAPQTGQK